MPKMPKIFNCEYCHFTCSKSSNFTEHLSTAKHLNRTNLNAKPAVSCQPIYTCKKCNKTYKARNSLWYHEKKCVQTEVPTQVLPESSSDIEKITQLFFENIKQNQEFQKQMFDNIREIPTNNTVISNSNNNSNNKFNLNVFLNEKCKDAMNIGDFVNSLQLQIKDLENTGEYGFAEGISRIFTRGLKELDVYKRPIHCSDLKREILHMKSDGQWEKTNGESPKLIRAIKQVANKNINLMSEWKKENPGCEKYNSRKNDLYLKLTIESMGPTEQKDEERDFGKIIRSIAKDTIIEKEGTMSTL